MIRVDTRPRKAPRSGIRRAPDRDCPGHLQWLRGRPCLVASSGECRGRIQPHHVKRQGNGGTGLKPADSRAVPLCDHHHNAALHQHGEPAFERRYGVDLPGAADAYWLADKDHRHAWQRAQERTG